MRGSRPVKADRANVAMISAPGEARKSQSLHSVWANKDPEGRLEQSGGRTHEEMFRERSHS